MLFHPLICFALTSVSSQTKADTLEAEIIQNFLLKFFLDETMFMITVYYSEFFN